jgi:hypothetical protein
MITRKTEGTTYYRGYYYINKMRKHPTALLDNRDVDKLISISEYHKWNKSKTKVNIFMDGYELVLWIEEY